MNKGGYALEIINMKCRPRSGKGKSYTHKAKASGWVPAIYYGHSRDTKMLEVDARVLQSLIRKSKTNFIFNLNLQEEGSESLAIIKEIQRHPFKDKVIHHVDFQHIAMDEKITVDCPIHITGIAIGVKEDGGILQHPVRSIAIECFPGDIPEFISVDVSNLKMGESIHVKDLTVENVVFKDSADEVVAVIVHTQAATDTASEEAEGDEESADQASKAAGDSK